MNDIEKCCGCCGNAASLHDGGLICCSLGGQPHEGLLNQDKFGRVRFGDGKSCPEFTEME